MRKHLAATAVACLLATPALAQTTTATGTGVGVSESNSAAGAIAVNRGNGGSVTINQPSNVTSDINTRASGTTTIRSAPSMVAPGLTAAGLETCLGSASGTVSAVGFGIGGGSTYKDEDCTARLDSRTLYAMGLKAAAVARLCQRPDVWRSMPDICQQYWPANVPVPYGVVIAAPSVVMSANAGIVRVIDGRDGVEKDCLNYNAGAQKCTHWLGEQPRKKRQQVAHVAQPQRIVVKPKPKPQAEAAPPEKISSSDAVNSAAANGAKTPAQTQ